MPAGFLKRFHVMVQLRELQLMFPCIQAHVMLSQIKKTTQKKRKNFMQLSLMIRDVVQFLKSLSSDSYLNVSDAVHVLMSVRHSH